jgi:ribosomal subunit interface protein
MKNNLEFKSFEAGATVRNLINRLTSKLEKNTKHFSPDPVHLRLMVEHNAARTLYNISLTLDLPGTTLAAKQEQHDVNAGIRAAFEEIERQVKKHKASLRQEHWKRPTRREEVREMKAEAASAVAAQSKREAFFALITPHLERLHHFVHHVIAYSEAMGDMVEGDVTPRDIVDGALIRGYREFLTGRSIPNVRRWSIRLALDQLDSAVARLKIERVGTADIEEGVPEATSREESSTLADEILDLYRRDELLKTEDLIPDLENHTPEDEVEREELRRRTDHAA